ncbi:ABC transporter ATP-binding protein [Micromonospora sp. NPDC000207]|uniref:ABC transporter ATP-binding protein n=1 Tax=Micromonospora sp. NPDC000207 TaxID=3154246 RepID=UPI0033177B9D
MSGAVGRFGGIVDAARARAHVARLIPRAGWPLAVGGLVLNVVLGLLPVVFLVATSVLLGHVPAAVRDGLDSPAWERLVTMLVLAGVVMVVQQVLTPVQAALGELVARRVDGHVFGRLMTASLAHPGLAAVEDQTVRDDLAIAGRELEHGYQSPGGACAGLLALVARYVQLTGCVVAIGVAFSWAAALAVAVAVLLFRQAQRGGLRRYSAVFRRLAPLRRESTYLRDLATGRQAGKEIRVYGLTGWLADRYEQVYLGWMRPVWAERRRVYLRPFIWLTLVGLLVTGVVLGSVGVSADPAALTRFVLVAQVVLAAVRLGDYYPEADDQTQFGMNAYDAVRSVEAKTARHRDLPETTTATNTPDGPGEIRFTGVGFAYPGTDRAVLDGLDLTIAAGRCTALVGLNGAGKTTLVKLLARLYDPTAGAVLVDGVDLRDHPVGAWRARLGITFQDYLRYDATAADNIGFGAVEHLDDTDGILDAARRAGVADTLLALPDGLDTVLTPERAGGVDLSGGQWQRVAIARSLFALRHGASVLVLDEPTASLDVRAEARFYDEFVSLTRGVTTVLISHRFATVRRADHIVVLADGRVLEQGSHTELMDLDGRYAQLFSYQAQRFTDPTASPTDPTPETAPTDPTTSASDPDPTTEVAARA